jgi:hypothetical protein
MAVTAVTELGLDGETRDQMLTTAAEEATRAAAELAAIGSLVTCVVKTETPVACDVGATIRDVASVAVLGGRQVSVGTTEAGTVLAGPEALRDALTSLVALVASAGGAVTMSAHVCHERTVLRITNDAGGDLPEVVNHLVTALGGQPEPAPTGVAFSLLLAR